MRSTGQGRSATRTCGEQTCHQIPARTPHNGVLRMKPERELIEVVGEVLAIDGALVGAEKPSLEQRGHPVDARQQRVRVLAAAPDDQPAMAVARLWQDEVGRQAVGNDEGAGSDRPTDERQDARGGRVQNAPEANPTCPSATHLCRDHDQGFLADVPTAAAFLDAPDEGFIHLHLAGQQVPARPNHRSTELVEPRPCRLVAAESEDALKAEGAGAVRLGRHPPHGLEPEAQGAASAVEHGPRGHRDLTAAALAVHERPLGQPCLGRLAARAVESTRPPQLREVLPTGILRREPAVEFCQGARVLGVGHAVTLPVAVT